MADISSIKLPSGNTYDIKDSTARSAIPTKVSQLTNDSGFITGMTILSYGSSTWADFEAAYNANKVVYCRASSNANPASGSQTRLAFMAYVNNATTPTNVEFQYYRSMSSHTASQQGDQVFVYKLDKTSGWSVITREASVKVVAGDGLGGTYSNGTMTLTGPTKVSDLTNDSGFITSYTETDPTVPSWAKASSKPSYTASEVGAAASSHTHGNITNSGDITTNATIASGDRIIINDESASKITNSSITFGSSTTQYLANNGTWQNVPTVPTKTSDLTNDSGFITSESDPVFSASAAHGITSTDITNWNGKSDFSGNYNDLTNKPTIPAAVTESTVAGWGFTKNTGTYSKPSGGIPKTDLASAVQTSLGKADTALQSYTESDPVFTASVAAGITSSDISDWNGKVDDLTDLGITATATELNYTDGVTSNIQDQLDAMAKAVSYTASGPIASFTAEADNMPVISLVADIEPKQSGSGDPAPDNIRPISGWTGCNVTRAGKNLWNKDRADAQNGYYFLSGEFHTDNSYRCLSFPCSPGDKFKKSGSGWGGIVTFWNNDSFVSGVNNTSVTIPSGANIVKVACQYNSADAQLELGSSATAYEAYQGATLTVDWTSEAGTVYGGTIDVATGVLTVTDGYIASYNGETLPSTWISDRDVYASGTTPTTGAEVVYKLDTQQTYQLTPQQLLTLLGTNNVWADTGNVSVTFAAVVSSYLVDKGTYSSGQLLQNRNLAYVESGTRASRAYSVNNYFVNSDGVLCRITTSVSSGGTLIQGTNYIVVTGGLANDNAGGGDNNFSTGSYTDINGNTVTALYQILT